MDQTGEGRPEATGLSEQGVDGGLMEYRSHTEDDFCVGMETDTGSLARSTLARLSIAIQSQLTLRAHQLTFKFCLPI